jgi:hypothetical protein
MNTKDFDWEETIGKLVGAAVAHQGVTRPVPNLQALAEDCQKIGEAVDRAIQAERQQLLKAVEVGIAAHRELATQGAKDYHRGAASALEQLKVMLFNEKGNL